MRVIKFVQNYKNKVFVVSMLILTLLLMLVLSDSRVYAEYTGNPNLQFEKMDLEEELNSIDGFSFEKYTYDITATAPQIFNFVEYCYAYDKYNQANYGLYVYIYNPQNTKFEVMSERNMITMAVAWDRFGKPTEFEKFKLQFISKIEEGQHANLFYKFKIVDKRSNLDNKYIVERVNRDNRLYSISEFELLSRLEANATAYKIGATYSYTGFSEGYGENPNTNSTLQWSVTNLETIVIDGEDIGFSVYIMPYNNGMSMYHYDQINSVYFSVPNKILSKYGNLQKVKFLTYGYDTELIVVTENQVLANKLLDGRSKPASSVPVAMWNDYTIKTTIIGGGINGAIYEHRPTISYNYGLHKMFGNNKNVIFRGSDKKQLPYVFYKQFEDKAKRTDLTSKEMLDYIYNYNASNNKGYIPHRNITADLFTTIEPKYFGEPFEIDAGDLQTLTSYNMANAWDLLWYKLFNKKPKQYLNELKPIEKVPTKYTLDQLYIHKADEVEFKEKMAIAKVKDRAMHCFRFAITDYYSEPANYDYLEKFDDKGSGSAYFARTSAFLDFDIIQLTFSDKGEMTVVPVVMSPIDIIGNIQSPAEIDWSDFWDKLLAILMAIISIILTVLAIFAIIYFLPLIQPIFSAIAAPFKATGRAIKDSKFNRKMKKLEKQEENMRKQQIKDKQREVDLAKERFTPKKE